MLFWKQQSLPNRVRSVHWEAQEEEVSFYKMGVEANWFPLLSPLNFNSTALIINHAVVPKAGNSGVDIMYLKYSASTGKVHR